MLTHDDILAALRQEFASAGAGSADVYLVARLNDTGLGTASSTPYVFIPDVHIVPPADATKYPWVTARAEQIELLTRLAGVLARLRRTDGDLRVWQLGDFFDLWRVGELGGAGLADVSATQAALPALFTLLYGDVGLNLVAGNHDAELLTFRLPSGPQALKSVILDRGSGTADAVAVHGDQFDPIEDLKRDWKEPFARGFRELVPPTPRSMLEAANPHWDPTVTLHAPGRPADLTRFLHFDLKRATPAPVDADAVNVVAHAPHHDPAKALLDSFGGGRKPTVDGPRQTFFTDAAWWAQEMKARHGHDVRLMVIGHTHRARIVRGKRPDGTLFVLMDCGAFVDSGFLSDEMDDPIANAQIGVKVGTDLRVYQLGYTIRRDQTVNP